MKKNTSAYLIMVTSEREGRRAFSVRVTRGALVATAAVACLVLAALGLLFYTAAETARLHRLYGESLDRNDKLTKENILLRQITGTVGRMDTLAQYLERLASAPAAAPKQTREPDSPGAENAGRDAGTEGDPAEDAFDVLPVDGWITQKFTRDNIGTVEHPGIDIAAPEGTGIRAPAPGTVKSVTTDRYYGKMIVIGHANGYETRYGHCHAVFVSPRETVVRGQNIAQVGSTGNSTAPHLHYEIVKNGKNINPLDVLHDGRK